jgi:hypothetical protein
MEKTDLERPGKKRKQSGKKEMQIQNLGNEETGSFFS